MEFGGMCLSQNSDLPLFVRIYHPSSVPRQLIVQMAIGYINIIN